MQKDWLLKFFVACCVTALCSLVFSFRREPPHAGSIEAFKLDSSGPRFEFEIMVVKRKTFEDILKKYGEIIFQQNNPYDKQWKIKYRNSVAGMHKRRHKYRLIAYVAGKNEYEKIEDFFENDAPNFKRTFITVQCRNDDKVFTSNFGNLILTKSEYKTSGKTDAGYVVFYPVLYQDTAGKVYNDYVQYILFHSGHAAIDSIYKVRDGLRDRAKINFDRCRIRDNIRAEADALSAGETEVEAFYLNPSPPAKKSY